VAPAQTGWQRCCPRATGPSFAKRIGCQAAQMPSESEPIEAKPQFFGPSKRQPLKSQPGRAAKRPLTSGWLPTDLGPGSAWPAGRGSAYQRRALGLGPGQAPRPPSARALAWLSVPSNPANRSGDPPWEASKAPKPYRQPGQSRETPAKEPTAPMGARRPSRPRMESRSERTRWPKPPGRLGQRADQPA